MITVDYLKQQRHRQATAYIFFLFQQQKKTL